jgi:hypothetical protein
MAQTYGSVYGKNKFNSFFLSFVDCTPKYLRRSTWISWKMMPMGFLRYKKLNVGYLLLKKVLQPGLEKTRFFFKNPAQCFFLFFFGFFVFFWFFWGFFSPEERVLGFFSVSRILLGASRL